MASFGKKLDASVSTKEPLFRCHIQQSIESGIRFKNLRTRGAEAVSKEDQNGTATGKTVGDGLKKENQKMPIDLTAERLIIDAQLKVSAADLALMLANVPDDNAVQAVRNMRANLADQLPAFPDKAAIIEAAVVDMLTRRNEIQIAAVPFVTKTIRIARRVIFGILARDDRGGDSEFFLALSSPRSLSFTQILKDPCQAVAVFCGRLMPRQQLCNASLGSSAAPGSRQRYNVIASTFWKMFNKSSCANGQWSQRPSSGSGSSPDRGMREDIR
jgi:hypothetical protein